MSITGVLTGELMPFLLLLIAFVILVFFTLRARRGRRPSVRSLPAFDNLPTELGKGAEAGASLHLSLGSGGVGGGRTLTSLAALQVLEGIADAAVSYGTLPIVTVGDPTLLPLAQDVLRRAANRLGVSQRYDPTNVRFISSFPDAYALGASDVLAHEKVIANVLAGSFGEEVSLLTGAGEGQDLTQMAAVDRLRALGALYPADTSLAAGEELYAGGARLMREPRYLASLRTQDVLRFLVVAAILLKALGVF